MTEDDVRATPGETAWGKGHGLSARHLAAALGQSLPTAAQQRVIEASPSPALVIAGAGSGKTETMAGRVVWLVANGHVRREEVLGLTFTRKAAGELAERIARRLAVVDDFGRRGLLPHLAEIVESGRLDRVDAATTVAQRHAVRRAILDELADEYGTGWDPGTPPQVDDLLIRPRVATYNAFADGIVREHAARIGRDPDAAMLSASASWLLARSVVLRADLAGLEDIDKAVSTIVDAVQRMAGDVLDHRADLAAVERVAEETRAALAPYRAHRDVAKPVEHLAAVPLLVALVRAYQAEKHRRGVLDFADQVAGAIDIVEAAPDVRDEIREQYRVVLLDEYQDTSVLQTRFLARLFSTTAVMAVGDPHQSIYGWRGASADNLFAFAREFAPGASAARFHLLTSWRNDVQILRVANRVLQPLSSPGDDAVPALEPREGAGRGQVDMEFAQTVDDEAERVAEWFASQRRDVDEVPSGAVLFRSKRHMPTFAAALARRGVPHRILGLGGLLSTPEVVDVVAALRVLDDPSAGSSLIRLLVGPRFAVGVRDMAALYDLAVLLAQRDGALRPLPDDVRARVRASRGVDEAASLVDAVDVIRALPDDYRLLEGFTSSGRARIREAAESFHRLRAGKDLPLPELLRLIERELRLDVELAANESRGPARAAATQLRAFGDEVRGFLSADERGSIGSLLAWLDRAERADDLAPRMEAPEPGVVQLLTVHGSKGLEWDAVAVVRLVDDELPARPHETSGWLGFGVLPYALRGDRSVLPSFSWNASDVSVAAEDPARRFRTELTHLRESLTTFKGENAEYQRREERRLAYVAFTRARSRLLLTGSFWSGQSTPRRPSPYLLEALDALGLPDISLQADEDNPYAGEGRTQQWPLDPLGVRRHRVEEAAARVRQAEQAPRSVLVERLLAEREDRERAQAPHIPTRVPASRFKDYVSDFDHTLATIARPMPERPYRQTRIGTLFHQWVENRSGRTGSASSLDDALWGEHDDESAGEAVPLPGDEHELARLRDTFLRSEWAPLQPLEVETEIDFPLPAADGGEPHLIICKLDAVYRRDDRGGRIEIVDWKTGAAPRTAEEQEERLLQLALYRLAYHRRHGVPLEQIDVALYYVSDDVIIRDSSVRSEAELASRWAEATSLSGRGAPRRAAPRQ